MQSNAVLI